MLVSRYADMPTMYWVARWVAPLGVLSLDFDAPATGKGVWLQPDLWERFRSKVVAQCTELAERYDLGRFWMYRTGSPGFHVIFENRRTDWREIMKATYKLDWAFPVCRGYFDSCWSFCSLRVGYKYGRDWDLRAMPGNPVGNIPYHVQDHDRLLRERFHVADEEDGSVPVWPC